MHCLYYRFLTRSYIAFTRCPPSPCPATGVFVKHCLTCWRDTRETERWLFFFSFCDIMVFQILYRKRVPLHPPFLIVRLHFTATLFLVLSLEEVLSNLLKVWMSDYSPPSHVTIHFILNILNHISLREFRGFSFLSVWEKINCWSSRQAERSYNSVLNTIRQAWAS